MLNHTKSHTSAVYTRERVFTDSIVCVCVREQTDCQDVFALLHL